MDEEILVEVSDEEKEQNRKSFARVENGVVTETELPVIGELADGSQVSNFDRLPEEELAELGWYPIEESAVPEHDPNTQNLIETLTVIDDKVLRTFSVETYPEPTDDSPPGSLEARIASLEADVAELKDAANT